MKKQALRVRTDAKNSRLVAKALLGAGIVPTQDSPRYQQFRSREPMQS